VSSSEAESESTRFRRLGVVEGVSHTTVWSLSIDELGFVWIATESNVQRYDGYEFRDYVYDPLDPHSLPGREVVRTHIDRSNQLWLATRQGAVGRYDSSLDRFENYGSPPFPVEFVTSLASDAEGRVWVSTFGTGLARLTPSTGEWRQWSSIEDRKFEPRGVRANAQGVIWAVGKSRLLRFAPGVDDPELFELPRAPQGATWGSPGRGASSAESRAHEIELNGIAIAPDDSVWVGTSNGVLFRYDPEEGLLRYVAATDRPLWKMEFAPDGRLWISTYDDGAVAYSPDDGSVADYQFDPSDPDSLSSDEVIGFAFDRSGAAWLGTRDGLSVEDRSRSFFRVLRDRRDGRGLIGTSVQVLETTPDGSLWIGMANGAVQRWWPGDGRLETVYSVEEAPVGGIEFLGEDREGRILVSGGQNTVHFDPKRGVTDIDPVDADLAWIRGLAVDADSVQWYASLGKALGWVEAGEFVEVPVDDPKSDLDDATSLLDTEAYSILIDREGAVWAGLETGLSRYDPKTKVVTSWRNDPNDPQSLAGGTIPAMLEDSKGRFWVGTYGAGLDRFDRETGTFEHFTVREGLPSDHVVGILEDDHGHLWISTNGGLSRFDPEADSFRNFDSHDGLASDVFLMGGAARFEDGTLAFGGKGGVTIFHPDDLGAETMPPQVVLTDLSIDGVRVHPGGQGAPLERALQESTELTLSHEQSTFAIGFSGLGARNPDGNRFSFQLEGVDAGWTEVGADARQARYTKLDPGEYRFRVLAGNRDGAWTEEPAEIIIRVLPPWWLSTWAYSLYALGLIGGIVGYGTWQNKRLEHERMISAQLRQVDRLKNEFLANTSHELRTPLFGMTGLAESLVDGARGELPHDVEDDLNMIVSSGRRLGSLVDDILDFSRLQDRDLQLQLRSLNLHSLVELVVVLSRPLAEGKEVELLNAVPRDLDMVLGDENRVQQILLNLIGNAIKFTDRGTVAISARRSGDFVVVDVEDSGIGISPEQIARIFEPFEQADASASRVFGGTGLGLAITRDLVQFHGGTLTADSVVGEGSRFRFTLPAVSEAEDGSDVSILSDDSPRIGAEVDRQILPPPAAGSIAGRAVSALPMGEADEPTRAPLGQTESPSQHKILVVDDEPVVRQVLLNQLSSEGYEVIEAKDGPEALRRLDDELDLVLLDIMMPRMSGFEVCDSIRQRYSIEQLPVIYLSAKNQVEDLLNGFASGANDYVAKPVAKDELIARVKTHLELRDLNSKMESLVEKRTDQVKRLGGLLPICSSCKKIRDDDGYWRDVETFLDQHSDATFTHGLCDHCITSLYPELEIESKGVSE